MSEKRTNGPEGEREMFPSFDPGHLLELLSDHSRNYNDGEPIPVRFGEGSYIDEQGRITIDPRAAWYVKENLGLSEEDGVRVMLDTLSHEVEHKRETNLSSKREVMEEFPKCGKLAGTVLNVVEDYYIDMNRIERFKGLKVVREWEKRTDMWDTPLVKLAKGDAMVKILMELSFFGEVQSDIEREQVRVFAEKAERKMRRVPRADTQAERIEIARELTATIYKYADYEEMEEFEELLDEILEEIMEAVEEWVEENPEEAEELMEEIMEGNAMELPEEDDGDAEEDEEEAEIEMDVEVENIDDAEEDIDEEESPDSDADVDADADDEEDDETDSEATSGANEAEESDDDMEDDTEDGKESEGSDADDDHDAKEQNDRAEQDDDGDGEEREGGKRMADLSDRWTEPGSVRDNLASGDGGDNLYYIPKEETAKASIDAEELSEQVIEAFEQIRDLPDWKPGTRGAQIRQSAIVRRAAGDFTERRVFKRKEERERKERIVGIALDASGSMEGEEMREAMRAVGAVGIATDYLNDDFCVNTFSTEYNTVDVAIQDIVEPGDEFDIDALNDIEISGLTPTAIGIADIREKMDSVKKEEKVIFVVTDGNPNVHKDGTRVEEEPGDTEEDIEEKMAADARTEVNKARNRGYAVIGIAVGNAPGENIMDKVFGSDRWFRFDPDELADRLLDVYRDEVM